MSSATAEKVYSIKEYLELEKHSEVRHEYYYGKLITMPGESKTANRIANNILAEWRKPLIKQDYECYTHDVKTQILTNKIYRYPDLVVAPADDDEDEFIIKTPVIMIEVASEDSWKRDTHNKRKEYTALPSMHYYIVISQEEMYVEVYRRSEKEWILQQFEMQTDIVSLPKFDLSISLEEIYHRVKFGEAKTDVDSND